METVAVDVVLEPISKRVVEVQCPAGKRVISGGFAYTGDLTQFPWIYQSFPSSATAWTIGFHNNNVRPQPATAYAVCAEVA